MNPISLNHDNIYWTRKPYSSAKEWNPMLGIVRGRVWKYGDNINSDLIHPPKFFSLDEAIIREGAMKGIDPDFSSKVKNGDIIVAGVNFGCGSGRETAVLGLILSGISVVIAETFARMFFRNAINLSLPVIKCPHVGTLARTYDELEVDLDTSLIRNLTTGKDRTGERIPYHLKVILEKGGLMNTIL
jgi:3-isopropylmalate/(R)-2-methylmalate dehydratase small subunit